MGNFIDYDFLKQIELQIQTKSLLSHLHVQAIGEGIVTHFTLKIMLKISTLHFEILLLRPQSSTPLSLVSSGYKVTTLSCHGLKAQYPMISRGNFCQYMLNLSVQHNQGTINLLYGSTPPLKFHYPPSRAEHKVMEEYTREALKLGYSHPSLHLQ